MSEADDVCTGVEHAELGREAVKRLLSVRSSWEGIMAACAHVLQDKGSAALLAGGLAQGDDVSSTAGWTDCSEIDSGLFKGGVSSTQRGF